MKREKGWRKKGARIRKEKKSEGLQLKETSNTSYGISI